jgi:hypothetical protein
MLKSLRSLITSAPLAAGLAILSAAVTLVVAISTVSAGQVPGNAGLELIAALLLAAVAASEASRPQRRDRGRRRVGKAAETRQPGTANSDELAAMLAHRADVDVR